jgi:hypothetical protein
MTQLKTKGTGAGATIVLLLACVTCGSAATATKPAAREAGAIFEGKHYRGRGDVEYLRLLETARRMFEPDPEFQNLAMLYMHTWNGLVEGPTWGAWWIQNSYGTTYGILPLLREPFVTFLQNSQDLWFDQMGDGKRVGAEPPLDWVAPDGCLCDAARPGWIVYKQGDGRIKIHDWGMEFTAAGMVMQSELLLISRDPEGIAHYLPKLERSAAFIETRRATNHLFLAGPAGNLLAPSYAGWLRPDGTYDKAYLTGLSVTYIAALDRLIELEKLASRPAEARRFTELRDAAKKALALVTTEEGYFIRSLDPDGTRHGVYGAPQHGYFEASPNHDAIALRVADDEQSGKIFQMIASLPGLRPHDFILPNYPTYDDMYEKLTSIWAYGTWVNGGHWSTCEGRMMLAYYRLGKFDDARRSMNRLLTFAERFRMDNPLTKCGSDVYQPKQPINLTYDAFGPPAGFMRGLFEYLYRADGLTLVPHIPPSVTELAQLDPVRFGGKKIFLSVVGRGDVTGVRVNGRKWKSFDGKSVFLSYDRTPKTARVEILLGGAKPTFQVGRVTPCAPSQQSEATSGAHGVTRPTPHIFAAKLKDRVERVREFQRRLAGARLGGSYEAAHAQLILDCARAAIARQERLKNGTIRQLPEASEKAADQCYVDTVSKVCAGLEWHLKGFESSSDSKEKKLYRLWCRSLPDQAGEKQGTP